MSIAENLRGLRVRIASAAHAAGRDPAAVTLVAVSKGQPAQAVREAYEAGQRIFGESRVQEAAEKFTPLRALCPDLRLQMIGALQTNKAARAVALFDVIAALDRPKLAQVLAQEMDRQGKRPDLFIAVNIGEEPQKSGVSPAVLPEFLHDCRAVLRLPITGLMCIPPVDRDPRPSFEYLARLAETYDLPVRSMGMSGDFEAAIACGSTQIRLGTAVFGERKSDS